MWLTFVPVLGALRRLYDMPRDDARFDAYIGLIRQGDADGMVPLSAFKPMAREHVAEALDALLAIEAERVAAEALREIGPRMRSLPAEWGTELRVLLVLADDVGGMWTHRRPPNCRPASISARSCRVAGSRPPSGRATRDR